MNLIEGLQKELDRNRKLLKFYREVPTSGVFGAMMIKFKIEEAEKAIVDGDTVKMLSCYKELQKSK